MWDSSVLHRVSDATTLSGYNYFYPTHNYFLLYLGGRCSPKGGAPPFSPNTLMNFPDWHLTRLSQLKPNVKVGQFLVIQPWKPHWITYVLNKNVRSRTQECPPLLTFHGGCHIFGVWKKIKQFVAFFNNLPIFMFIVSLVLNLLIPRYIC